MFYQQEKFVIHKKNQPCELAENTTISSSLHTEIDNFIKDTYPKQKYMSLIFNILQNHNVINENLYFKLFNIHIADFCSFINNKFCKKIEGENLKLCKHLQKNNIKLPRVSIKNTLAQRFLC